MKLFFITISFCLLSSCGGGSNDAQNIKIPRGLNLTPQFTISRTQPLLVSLEATLVRDESVTEYTWDLGDGNTLEGKNVTHKYNQPGCYLISLSTPNQDSNTVEKIIRIVDEFPLTAEGLEISGIPSDNDLIPRDAQTNIGYVNLEIDYPDPKFETLVVKTFINEQIEEYSTELCGEHPNLRIPIKAERVSRDLKFSLRGLNEELVIGETKNIVAGDIYLINGQSNAVSSERLGSAEENVDLFVRSYGSRSEDISVHSFDSSWHEAVVGERLGGPGAVGQWPLRMASQLSSRFNLPIGIINSGHGGKKISYFQRNNLTPLDLTTNYGRMLDRTMRANALTSIRAILFYQGESDKGNAEEHANGFVKLSKSWQEDYFGVEKYYITQIRPGCGGENGGQLETREAQRQLPSKLSKTSIMSTSGLDGHDGCHFSYENGYRELGDRYANLIARDIYHDTIQTDVEAIDVVSASLDFDTIAIKTSSDATKILIDLGSETSFELRGGTRSIIAVRSSGDEILVDLGPGENPEMIGYQGHSGPGPWIVNSNGVGLLAFLLPIN